MIGSAVRARLRPDLAAWAGVALLAGLLAGGLPVMITAAGLVGVGLLTAMLIEPALGLLLMLSAAPLKTLIATEAPWALPVDIGQISLGLAVLSWALWRSATRPAHPLPRTPLYWPLMGIMLAFGPSWFAARLPGAWLAEMLKWVEMFVLVVVVLDLSAGRRWAWLAAGIVWAATLQAAIGLYQYRGGSGAPHLWLPDYVHFRAFGTFGQPNPFSAFMGLSLPVALGLGWGYAMRAVSGWRQMPVRRRWTDRGRRLSALTAGLYGLSALLLLAGLVVSWGRGAWLGFGAAAAVMVFFAPHKRWLGLALWAAAGTLVGLAWLAGRVPPGIQQRLNQTVTEFVGFGDMRAVPVNNENFAIVERLAHWQAAYQMASAHPFIGVGLGSYEAAYPDYGIPSWPRALGHAHNDYLNLLAEVGLVGLTGYLIGWGYIAYLTLRALAQPDPVLRGLVLGLLGTWTHLAVHSVVDKLYVNNLFLHIGVMLGLLAAAYRQSRHFSKGMLV